MFMPRLMKIHLFVHKRLEGRGQTHTHEHTQTCTEAWMNGHAHENVDAISLSFLIKYGLGLVRTDIKE